MMVGAPGITGMIVGYALKKVSKIIAVVVGIFVIGVLALAQRGIININSDRLQQTANDTLQFAINNTNTLVNTANHVIHTVNNTTNSNSGIGAEGLIMPGSFLMGFLIGFRKG